MPSSVYTQGIDPPVIWGLGSRRWSLGHRPLLLPRVLAGAHYLQAPTRSRRYLQSFRSSQALGSRLTTELSGRPLPPLRTGERAIHGEHGAPTLLYGPLQRVVRPQLARMRIATVPCALRHARW